MIELKYNESSQLRVRLAIIQSQLTVANNKVKQLERTISGISSPAKPAQTD